jgi:predicted nucleotidyltransferase
MTTETIITAIESLEAKYNIEILYACESGSRAWGFPSPDSDYDARFIYRHRKETYLSIGGYEEQIGPFINGDLDLNGWDIRKLLRLMANANSTPFEWLQSPIIYKEQSGFRDGLKPLLEQYFNPRTQINHYLGIATGALKAMPDGFKIKKLFYVLRPILAAKWIAAYNAYPPMQIQPMLELLSEGLKHTILKLINDKAKMNESAQVYCDSAIQEFIEEEMRALRDYSNSLRHLPAADLKYADTYFLNNIQ